MTDIEEEILLIISQLDAGEDPENEEQLYRLIAKIEARNEEV